MFYLKTLFIILCALVSVVFLVLLERKILGLVGLRFGPNKVSFLGFLQSVSDALKLMTKEFSSLSNFTWFFYFFCPFSMFFFTLFFFSCFFSNPSISSFFFPILMILVFMSFNVLNSMICGWSVYSKYSLIGTLRSVSQLISYEAVLYFCLIFFIFFYESFNFFEFNFFKIGLFGFILPLVFYFWVPSLLAELNRSPFDFSEGESELVAGFMTDFGSYSFTMIFLAEYGSILFLCFITSFFFFNMFFILFFLIMVLLVIWSRSVLPRYRFDKLMFLSWKFLIPFITFFFIFYILFIF